MIRALVRAGRCFAQGVRWSGDVGRAQGSSAVVRSVTGVLVADDDDETARLWVRALEREGFVARAAHDVASAMVAAKAIDPHVAVLDVHLGDEDGQVLGLKLRRRMPSLALVALTGDGRFTLGERSARFGFDAHLVKPVRPRDLVRMVDLLTMFGSRR